MTEPVVVLDAGVLDRAASDHEFRTVLRDLVGEGWIPVIPTVVLAETITGSAADAAANHVIERLGTDDTDQSLARRAGALRHRARRAGPGRVASGVDAMVAAHAADAGAGVVFTTDPADLRRLLADHPRIAVEKP